MDDRYTIRMFTVNVAMNKARKHTGYDITLAQIFTLFAIKKSKAAFGWCRFQDIHIALINHRRTRSRTTIQKELVCLAEMGLIHTDRNHKEHRIFLTIAGVNLLDDVERALRTTRFTKPK